LRALIFTTYQEAAKALQDEQYDAAETLVHELLSVDEEHTLGHVLLASIEANHGRVMQAHQKLDVALEINPLLADGYYLRALLYMEENETEAASRALHAALYCHRYHPLALFMLGNILGQNGQIARATRYWETTRQAISHLPPDDPVSDISNTTAGQLDAMARQQLDGWKD
jgi:predicted Zn-dependent protease